MRGVQNRPAVMAALSLLLGMIAANRFCIPTAAAWGIAVGCFFSLLFAYFRQKKRCFWALGVFALGSLGVILVNRQHRLPSSFDISSYADIPRLTALEGVVCSLPEEIESGATAIVQVDSVWIDGVGHSACGRCLVRWFYRPEDLRYGDRIVARGKLRLPPGERNPGDFDYRRYLAAQKISALFYVVSPSDFLRLRRGEGNPFMRLIVSPVQRFAVGLIDREIGGREGALLKGLLLGLRRDIDVEVHEAFADLGVIHVLAVSGLHVGFVAALLIGLFGLFRLREPWRSLAALAGLFFYAALTGFKPPVFRATIMAAIYLTGRLLQRKADLFNTLAVAAIIILLIEPLQLFEIGFQLSFAAVLGIGFFYGELMRPFEKSMRRLQEQGRSLVRAAFSLLMVSVSAQIATLPLTIAYFNRIPLYSLPANLLVVPTVQLIVIWEFLMLLIAPFTAGAASCLANLLWLGLKLLIQLVQWAADLPYASLTAGSSSAPYFLLVLCCFSIFYAWSGRRWRFAVIGAALVALNLIVWRAAMAPPHGLLLTFLDVGQGDAILLQFPNGKTMLVDCGDRTETFDAGRSIVVPYLRRQGVHKLHTLVLTHPHADHIAGAEYLLRHLSVGRVVWNNVPSLDPSAAVIDSLLQALKLPIKRLSAGDTLLLDEEAVVMVMHPPLRSAEAPVQNINNESIVLKCVAFGFSVLLTGDAEIPAETEMIQCYGPLLTAEILKLGHHGSVTASGKEFRRLVAAKTSIVSVGRGNRFGLPSRKLMKEISRESQLVRMDENGAVQFLIRPEGISRLR
ncbi:MAG: DNA internalization-related competence protein ComEC/Rec2 [candidate division KSB1 bacterium]|nr:DNA internalization-related competence protein ComEC/Rec2 [candidate division KSB1 bacterium]